MAKEEYHWADQVATRVIEEKGNKKKYVCAAGITPSGTIHIGNFREIITVDLISKALKTKKKEVRFIYSWDNYDVFRKVPKNMPKQELLKEHLREPIIDVPDPFGTAPNYARHHEIEVEENISKVDITPEFLYQAKKYRKCEYAEGIKIAMQKKEEIIEILNKWRKEKLSKDWWPITGFCEKCKKDLLKFSNYDGEYQIDYVCKCGFKKRADFRKDGEISLKWRIDWPMRWAHEKVDFEPGGKDHSTAGGSYTTAKNIVKLYDWEAPSYQMYDFVRIKGAGGKISSSLGNIITLKDCLEIYEPCIVRYLFAGTRPNREFAISFDLDVIKIYEDFDRTERFYFGKEKIENEKRKETEKRNYELSAIEIPKTMPLQPSFRYLTTLIQIFDYDEKKVMKEFDTKNDFDKRRLKQRIECAVNWLNKYAPDEMKFEVQKDVSNEVKDKISENQKKAIKLLNDKLKEKKFNEKELGEEIYDITKKIGIKPKEFFEAAYLVLLNKKRGPRLAPFIITLGEKATDLFSRI
jgi:lysyl-tRNA synthetase, class I